MKAFDCTFDTIRPIFFFLNRTCQSESYGQEIRLRKQRTKPADLVWTGGCL